MLQRKNCRDFYRELRNAMPQEAVIRKSKTICQKVFVSKEYKQAQVILAYYPLGKEVDCLIILEQVLKDGKRLALPRTAGNGQMDFYEIHSMDEVEEGTFHVMEPKQDCVILLPDSEEFRQKDVLALIPGVVFDKEGNRCGYGKGYYDRYFARFPLLKRMALAYAEQISEEKLLCLDTDVKMHIIVTDAEQTDIKLNMRKMA